MKSNFSVNNSNILNKERTIYKNTDSIFNNKIPFIYIGVVTSIFINSKTFVKYEDYNIGILIESNIVLVNYNAFISSKEEFEILDLSFKLLNLTKKYLDLLPNYLRVKDYYTPFNIVNYKNLNKSNFQDEILSNGWGIISLELPLGDILNYITLDINNKKNKMLGIYSGNIYNEIKYAKLKPMNDDDISNSKILFCEGIFNNSSTNSIDFKVEDYSITLDESLFLLSNSNKKPSEERSSSVFDNNIPGIIISHSNYINYIIGISLNIDIELENESNKYKLGLRITKEIYRNILENIEQLKKNSTYLIYNELSIDWDLYNFISRDVENEKSFKNLLSNNAIIFYNKIFNYFTNLNTLKSNNKSSKSVSTKYNSNKDISNQIIDYSNNYQYKLFILLIYNKISIKNNLEFNFDSISLGIKGINLLSEVFKYASDITCINLSSNLIFSQGLKEIIYPIYHSKQLLSISNFLEIIILDNNKLSSKSLKYLRYLLKASFNLKHLSLKNNCINYLGLKYILNCFDFSDFNLCDKSKSNNTSNSSTLSNSKLCYLNLSNNLLDKKASKYIYELIIKMPYLSDLYVDCNSLEYKGFKSLLISKLEAYNNYKCSITNYSNISTNLSRNNIDLKEICNEDLISTFEEYILKFYSIKCINFDIKKVLNLSNNFIGNNLINFNKSLFNNTNVYFSELNLSNIKLNNSGLINILDNKLVSILNLNLSRNYIDCEGTLVISNYVKFSNSLKTINLGYNLIGDKGSFNIAESLIFNNNTERSCDSNVNFTTQKLEEIKLNSNLITSIGGEAILKSFCQCYFLNKINLEDNNIYWRESGYDIKMIKKNSIILY